jgi:hypothetical protein
VWQKAITVGLDGRIQKPFSDITTSYKSFVANRLLVKWRELDIRDLAVTLYDAANGK